MFLLNIIHHNPIKLSLLSNNLVQHLLTQTITYTNLFHIILCLVAVPMYEEESSRKYVIKTSTGCKQQLVFYGEAVYDSHYFFCCLLISGLFSEARISVRRLEKAKRLLIFAGLRRMKAEHERYSYHLHSLEYLSK